jgi:hypothetical protein
MIAGRRFSSVGTRLRTWGSQIALSDRLRAKDVSGPADVCSGCKLRLGNILAYGIQDLPVLATLGPSPRHVLQLRDQRSLNANARGNRSSGPRGLLPDRKLAQHQRDQAKNRHSRDDLSSHVHIKIVFRFNMPDSNYLFMKRLPPAREFRPTTSPIRPLSLRQCQGNGHNERCFAPIENCSCAVDELPAVYKVRWSDWQSHRGLSAKPQYVRP